MEVPNDLAMSPLGIYPNNMKTLIWKDVSPVSEKKMSCTIAMTWKQGKFPPTEKQIKKWFIYTMECHSVIENDDICSLQQHKRNER